jgi:hypothetical protein
LAFYNALSDAPCLKQVNGQASVIAALHKAVEHLLNNIIHDVVQKVIPRETEEEVLEDT